jgi:release factor glutamine methyltransferase
MQNVWTLKKTLDWTIDFFSRKEVPEARLSAELLLAGVLGCKRIDLYLQFDRLLTPAELKKYREFIQRRAGYEPVQYVLGEQEFMGLRFKVSPHVLIPRPETEILVEKALQLMREKRKDRLRVLDIGTGSGAISLSLARYCPGCSVTAIDNSEAAIAVAKENAQRLDINTVEFKTEDAVTFSRDSENCFDLIISNPPYVSEADWKDLHPQVREFEPREALFAGTAGLDFYKTVVPGLLKMLCPEGLVFMEIGHDQKVSIRKIFEQNGFTQINFIKDYSEIDRIVKAGR